MFIPLLLIWYHLLFAVPVDLNSKKVGKKSIGIGLEASSTSKGPHAKTTQPMDSTKVIYCSIQLVKIEGIFIRNIKKNTWWVSQNKRSNAY